MAKKKKEKEYNFRLNIDTEEKPKIHVGWLCPICKAVYSPYVRKCDGCIVNTHTWVHEEEAE